MSDREQRGLRGPVQSCAEYRTHSGMTSPAGETHSEYTTEFDNEGRISTTSFSNSDGSKWVMKFEHDAYGRLLKTTCGVEDGAMKQTTYLYDSRGRLLEVRDEARPSNPSTFAYDEHGRKTKTETSSPEDYRPNTATAGSPFEAADTAPNLPGGGSATTFYDEHDRAIEIEVRDAEGELVSRALRKYDVEGRVVEEQQVLDRPELVFPADVRAKMIEESGISPDELMRELRAQLTHLMLGQSSVHSVSYRHDDQGRVINTNRRMFNHQHEIDTVYNEQGDIESEVTRSTLPDRSPSFAEARYSYGYDHYGNWTEQEISYRNSPDSEFQSSTIVKRTLTYH
jgi:YD repeat-containing protein